MLWTIPTFSRKSKTHFTALAWLCVSFSAISQAVAASDTNATQRISDTLEILNTFIQSDQYSRLGTIDTHIQSLFQYLEDVPTYENRVLAALTGRQLSDSFSWSDTDNIRNWAHLVARAMYGTDTPTGAQKNKSIISILEQIRTNTANAGGSTNIINVTPTNIVNLTNPDVLAGNPWWATNSAFAITRRGYSHAYPEELPRRSDTYSFPQFMSQWSQSLTYPTDSGVPDVSQWASWFGRNRLASFSYTDPYTWFDFMADWQRSNSVVRAAILDELRDMGGDMEHTDYVLDEMCREFSSYFSQYLASSSNLVSHSESNLVLVSQNFVTSNEIAEVTSDPQYTEYLADESVNTNAPPELELEKPNAPAINPFSDAADVVLQSLPNSNGGTPVITVIPEMNIGGIHVAEGRGYLAASHGTDSTTAFYTALRSFMGWFWKLLGFLGVFFIIKHEYNFWVTLGGSASE